MYITASQFQNSNADGLSGLADFLHGFTDARTSDLISTFSFFKIDRTLFDQILEVFIFLHVDPHELKRSDHAQSTSERRAADPAHGAFIGKDGAIRHITSQI